MEPTAEDIKVAYKEFPKSEFLEILAKPQKAGSNGGGASGEADTDKKGEPSAGSGSGQGPKSAKSGYNIWEKAINKRSLLFFMAGLLTAFGIIGIYLIARRFF